jgi:hypothetical protein
VLLLPFQMLLSSCAFAPLVGYCDGLTHLNDIVYLKEYSAKENIYPLELQLSTLSVAISKVQA